VSEAKRAAIRAIYKQVDAPSWAAANLDGLADVLRDLSWLPEESVVIVLPNLRDLTAAERGGLLDVVEEAVAEAAGSARPITLA
jgi:Barstar (barnase inhibitor)